MTTTQSVGKYALFHTRLESKRYAARIDGREGPKALLTWHFGNIYVASEEPASSTFTRSTQECTEALSYAALNAVGNVSFLNTFMGL